MGSQSELAAAIDELKSDVETKSQELVAQLNKALQEIIGAVGEVTPELQTAFDNMKAAIAAGQTSSKEVAQTLDDLHPDNP